MVNRYSGRCFKCGNFVREGAGQVHIVNGKWILSHTGECPQAVVSIHASGDFGLAKNIDGHEFKPDASKPTKKDARCAKCGATSGVAWISGAGQYLCYRHQDDY